MLVLLAEAFFFASFVFCHPVLFFSLFLFAIHALSRRELLPTGVTEIFFLSLAGFVPLFELPLYSLLPTLLRIPLVVSVWDIAGDSPFVVREIFVVIFSLVLWWSRALRVVFLDRPSWFWLILSPPPFSFRVVIPLYLSAFSLPFFPAASSLISFCHLHFYCGCRLMAPYHAFP